MPLKWVLHWQPNAGSTVNSQILSEVSQCVESINGLKQGRWKATLTLYKPHTREPSLTAEFPRDFLGVSVPEQPNKYYLIIRGQRIVLEADSSIQTIMEKLQSYKTRLALNFDVEYLPISSMEKARQIMGEFLEIWQEAVSKRSLPGQFMHIEPNFAEYGLADHYTSQHTAVQYATVMAQLIATVQAVQSVRN
ncbi:mediator of rna polymerase ii transcription subunit 20a [Quercus suber]|uniref:Mediator of RNA polymerase II transcription subunit 20 n=1 Tax=Quercus suber TaxID=58331 RepID=A0AAW0IY51_QUESU